jgi:hypothetical protein
MIFIQDTPEIIRESFKKLNETTPMKKCDCDICLGKLTTETDTW